MALWKWERVSSSFQQILETGSPGWSALAYNLVNIFEISKIHNVQVKSIYCLLTTMKPEVAAQISNVDILALLHGKIATKLIKDYYW